MYVPKGMNMFGGNCEKISPIVYLKQKTKLVCTDEERITYMDEMNKRADSMTSLR